MTGPSTSACLLDSNRPVAWAGRLTGHRRHPPSRLRDGGLGGRLPHDEPGGMAVGFRLYNSVKLGKGVRLNLSKTGVGVSAGVPGARYSVHSSGRTTRTIGAPGTGVYYRKDSYSKSGRSTGSSRATTPVAVAPVYPKAGVFAPKAEKVFAQGVTAYMQGRYADALGAFRDVEARDAAGQHVGEEYFAGMSLIGLERLSEAIPYFESVLASDYSIPDPLMRQFGVGGAMEVGVTAAVSVTLPMSNLAVALILAECYQRTDKRQKAIELLESLGAEAPAEQVFALRSRTSTSRWTSGTTSFVSPRGSPATRMTRR